MSLAVRRSPRPLVLALAVAALGALLVVGSGGPAGAQASGSAEIDGTAALKWQPSTVTIKPGGTVTFKISGTPPHPVGSGSSPPTDDKKFDTSACGVDKMSKVGASCTVKFPKAGTYPFFCLVHYASGMTGTITVGSGGGAGGGGGAPTTSGGVPVVTSPSAAPPPPPGHPAIYWAGWGLFALGALLALVFIALYVRFAPGFNRPRR